MSRQNDIWQRKPAGLVLGLDFSGGRVTSPTGHTGTLTNGASISGRTLVLDGVNDVLAFADSPDFTGSGTMTFSGWFNPSSPGLAIREFFGKYLGATNQRSYTGYADYPANRYVFAWSKDGADVYRYDFAATIPTSGWAHFTFVLNTGAGVGARVALYINGVSVSVSAIFNDGNLPPFDSTAELLIGAQGTSVLPVLPWSGSLAEFRIYNRALTAPEIAQLYHAGAARIALGGTP